MFFRPLKMPLPQLLWVLLLCSLPAFSQPAGGQGAQPALDSITIFPAADRVQVSITTGEPTKPVVSQLSHPDRLVFDFPRFVLPRPQRITVNRGTVVRVRASQFQINPAVARVVVDLQQPVAYELQSAGNVVTINISTSTQATRPTTSNIPSHPGSGASAASKPSALKRDLAPARVPAAVANTRPAPPPARQSSSGATAQMPLQPVPIPGWDSGGQSGTLQVTFQNGLLTVAADNATFNEIFREIGVKTGAEVEMPAMSDRVLTRRGPGSLRDVISQLLENSSYDFQLLESMSGRLRKIIIMRK